MGGRRQAGLDRRRAPAAGLYPRRPGGGRRGRVDRRRDRSRAARRRWRRRRGCRPRSGRGRAGGARRQDSVAAGFAALEAACRTPTVTAIVLVHDGARPGRRGRSSSTAVTRGGRIAMGRRSRSCRSSRPSSASTATGSPRPWTGRRWGPRRRPRASDARVWRSPRRTRSAAAGTWTDEAALLEACRIAVHAVPGDPTNLKVTVPADLARVAALLAPDGPRRPRPASGRTRIRSARVRRSCSAGSRSTGAPRLARSLRWRRRPPRRRRCACSVPPRSATSGGTSRRTRRRRRGSPVASSWRASWQRLAAAGWRRVADRPHDHRRPPAAGRPARRHAGGDRRRCSGSPSSGSA